MRKITRAMLRGKPLIHRNPLSDSFFDCDRATISHHEWGPDDPRQFCLGLVEWKDRDGDYGPVCKECQECPAWAMGDYCADTPWDKDTKFNPEARAGNSPANQNHEN